jgi:hypothetical protein
LEIGPDTRQIVKNLDAVPPDLIRRANTRQHQKLR